MIWLTSCFPSSFCSQLAAIYGILLNIFYNFVTEHKKNTKEIKGELLLVLACHLRMRNDIVHVTNVTNKRLEKWDFQKSLKGALKTMTFPVQHLLMISNAWYLMLDVSKGRYLIIKIWWNRNQVWAGHWHLRTAQAGLGGMDPSVWVTVCTHTPSAGPALSKITEKSVTGGGSVKYHLSCSFGTFSPSELRSVWNSRCTQGCPLGKHCEIQSLTKLSKPQQSPVLCSSPSSIYSEAFHNQFRTCWTVGLTNIKIRANWNVKN